MAIAGSLKLFICGSCLFPKDRDLWFHDSFHSTLEPALWVLAEEVQEQQRLAEAVGRLHQLLLVLLQNAPGEQMFGVSGGTWRSLAFCSSFLLRLQLTAL